MELVSKRIKLMPEGNWLSNRQTKQKLNSKKQCNGLKLILSDTPHSYFLYLSAIELVNTIFLEEIYLCSSYFRQIIILKLTSMSEFQSSTALREKNEEFIKSIKDKYTSMKKTTRVTTKDYISQEMLAQENNKRGLQEKGEILDKSAFRNRGQNNDHYRRQQKSPINLNEYQSLRKKYEQKDLNRSPYRDNQCPDLVQKMFQQQNTKAEGGKSSPIKNFYDSVQKKSDVFIAQRRQQIEQKHQQRASWQRSQRQRNEKTIQDVDSLIDNIRKVLNFQHYR